MAVLSGQERREVSEHSHELTKQAAWAWVKSHFKEIEPTVIAISLEDDHEQECWEGKFRVWGTAVEPQTVVVRFYYDDPDCGVEACAKPDCNLVVLDYDPPDYIHEVLT